MRLIKVEVSMKIYLPNGDVGTSSIISQKIEVTFIINVCMYSLSTKQMIVSISKHHFKVG